MPKFEIKYEDPENEGVLISEIKEFNDSVDPYISAEDWAEDYAYGRADKGYHTVGRIK